MSKKLSQEEIRIRNYEYNEINKRGKILTNYLEEKQLCAMNSFYNRTAQRNGHG